jgi:hypothetical protein
MSVSLKVFAATVAVLAVAATTSAQGRRPFEVPPGRTASQPGGTLTPPSNASPVAVLAQYLRGAGRDEATVRSLVQAAQSAAREGISQARFEQRAAGLPVYGTYAKAAFNDRGELVYSRRESRGRSWWRRALRASTDSRPSAPPSVISIPI